MQDAPMLEPEPKNLRFLRILVTVLTATMILGLLTIVALLVIRFANLSQTVAVPASISLPDGTVATAFTQGRDWYAVVTSKNQILIYDRQSGKLMQRVNVVSE